ncbi:MAG: hypothetical protein Q7K55_00690 [Candidatus Levybacteria bacterium]|nr:hypothetical protein [Candidatus Levybacteria bacterium]
MESDKIPQETPMAQAPLENEPIRKNLLKQNGNFLFILGVVVILVVFGVGGYLLTMSKNQNPNQHTIQPTVTTTQQNTVTNTSANWQEAEAKWQTFAQFHLEKMREIDSKTPRAKLPGYKFDRQFKEVSSDPLITKYLPKYRFYQEFDSNGGLFEFALRNDGHIIDLGTFWPTGYHTNHNLPDFEIMNYTDFIKAQKNQVNNSETALEMIDLANAIFEYPLENANADDQKSWKLKASKAQGKWDIRQEYIGDPNVMLGVPSSWEIFVDEKNFITEIRLISPN